MNTVYSSSPGHGSPHHSWGDNSAREPENEEWRLGVLESMIQIKQDNWSLIFSDEEEEDLLEENDIDMMIYEVCTS